MVGKSVLDNCIQDDSITEIVSFVRRERNVTHSKVTEVVVDDFADLSAHQSKFEGAKAAYFCIGVYTGQVSDDQFKVITVDYAVEFARQLEKASPGGRYILLSGAGADRTEKSKVSFAKYKGMAENQVSQMELEAHFLRPAYIYPVEARKEPNVGYTIFRWLYPLVKLFGNKYSIPSTDLAKAIYQMGLKGGDQEVYENAEIIDLLK